MALTEQSLAASRRGVEGHRAQSGHLWLVTPLTPGPPRASPLTAPNGERAGVRGVTRAKCSALVAARGARKKFPRSTVLPQQAVLLACIAGVLIAGAALGSSSGS